MDANVQPQLNPVPSPVVTQQPSVSQPQTVTPQAPVQETSVTPLADEAQSVSQPTDATQEENYIDNVGGSMIELMQDIAADEALKAQVAEEMRIDITAFNSILTEVSKKIEQQQLTKEVIALLLAASVVEEPDETAS